MRLEHDNLLQLVLLKYGSILEIRYEIMEMNVFVFIIIIGLTITGVIALI